MAKGRTHARFNIILLFIILVLPLEFFHPWDRLFFALGFLLSTFLVSPDMDMFNTYPYRRWGILKFLWLPYALLFKHRGISHVPVLGTITRVAYMLLVVSLLVLLILGSWEDFLRFILENDRALSFIILGMIVGDASHIFLDYLSSWRR